VQHLPAAGEVALFDHSWYNRAGVERVMGFCTDAEYQKFILPLNLNECWFVPGIILIKYWFSVSDEEQEPFAHAVTIQQALETQSDGFGIAA